MTGPSSLIQTCLAASIIVFSACVAAEAPDMKAVVDQPGDGGDDDVREGHDVGHAFWELRTNIPEMIFEEGLRRYLNVPMGFYPCNPRPRWFKPMGTVPRDLRR